MSVVDLDDYRPHIVVQTQDGNVHCYPLRTLVDYANGEGDVELEEAVTRRIVGEWLGFVTGVSDDS